jgi:hypothetical protein
MSALISRHIDGTWVTWNNYDYDTFVFKKRNIIENIWITDFLYTETWSHLGVYVSPSSTLQRTLFCCSRHSIFCVNSSNDVFCICVCVYIMYILMMLTLTLRRNYQYKCNWLPSWKFHRLVVEVSFFDLLLFFPLSNMLFHLCVCMCIYSQYMWVLLTWPPKMLVTLFTLFHFHRISLALLHTFLITP